MANPLVFIATNVAKHISEAKFPGAVSNSKMYYLAFKLIAL
jgi:hypothetical protein